MKYIFIIFKFSVDCRSFELVKRSHSNEINSFIQDLLSSIQQQKQLVNRFHVDTFIVKNTIIIKKIIYYIILYDASLYAEMAIRNIMTNLIMTNLIMITKTVIIGSRNLERKIESIC